MSRENVAAHAEVLRGGEEREGSGGGAGEEGAAVQTPGEYSECYVVIASGHHINTDKRSN